MIDVNEWIEKELGPKREFQPRVLVNTDGQCIQVFLEDCSYYAEWIKGERAEVAIYRAMDDNRVVGALLPLRKWNGKFPVDIV